MFPITLPGELYLYNPSHLNWTDARRACRDFGYDLAMFGSYREYDAITPFLPHDHKPYGYIWVGAKLMGEDLMNDFQWVSGEPLSPKFMKWTNDGIKNIEPDTVDQKCVIIYKDGNKKERNGPSLGTWNCHYTAPSLCQL